MKIQEKMLSVEEKEIFKVIKIIRRDYTLKDFLRARDRARKQIKKEKVATDKV